MPAINFKKEFVKKIQDGSKRSTIRAIRKDGRVPCREGDKLIMYTGQRTVHSTAIFVAKCKMIHFVKLEKNNAFTFLIKRNGERGLKVELDKEKLAVKEGFKNWEEMRDWFSVVHKIDFENGKVFDGFLIQW